MKNIRFNLLLGIGILALGSLLYNCSSEDEEPVSSSRKIRKMMKKKDIHMYIC